MIAKTLPNLFTIGNLILGMIAIILAFNDQVAMASIMVIIAMLTDGLDGRVARALNAQSEFGKELDSLSDLISFGVAPAFIAYVSALRDFEAAGWIVTAIFPICGALRLARFNVKAGVPGYFIGLPIPAAGGVVCTLALFSDDIDKSILLISCLFLSYLMVSNIKYPSFKRVSIPKSVIWITPFLIIAAVMIGFYFPGLSKLIFIPLVLYALWGLKKNVEILLSKRIKRKRRRSRMVDPEDQPIESEL